MLTHRQWVILQQALLGMRTERVDLDCILDWDDECGEEPTIGEIDALAQVVGDMPHENKP